MTAINTRNVTPGDMVVSFNDIVDVLKTKLTKTELDDLIRGIVSKRKPEVFPGDLITAELMNGILADLADLQLRVAKMETGSLPAPGEVKIERISPAGDLTVGETVIIEGKNFEYSLGATRVLFGTKSVFSFKDGSQDDRLIVDVRDPGGLPATVLLTVSNRNTSDYRTVTVKPAEIPLYGSVLANPGTVKPNPPVADSNALFDYTLISLASKEEDFIVKVSLAQAGETLSEQKYDNLVSVLDKDKKSLPDRKIRLKPNWPEAIFVKISKLPFADQSEFDILVGASATGVQDTSLPKRYKVGVADVSDDFLALTGISYTPPVIAGVATLATGQKVQANVTLSLTPKAKDAGVRSAKCDISLDLTDGSKWSLFLLDPTPVSGTTTKATGVVVTELAPATLEFAVRAESDASETGRMELVVTRQEQTGTPKKQVLPLGLHHPH